jgi:hypothetical protein
MNTILNTSTMDIALAQVAFADANPLIFALGKSLD